MVKGFQDSKGGTIPYAHILGLFHRLCKLLFYKIKPIFVFDGGIPDLKRETIVMVTLSLYRSVYENIFLLAQAKSQ